MPAVSHRIRIARAEHKFACAHMTVFPDGTKERLHGHNYAVGVELEVARIDLQAMIPFDRVKIAIRDVCAAWKERVLVAAKSPFLELIRDDDELELRLCGERYVMPRQDALLLPIDNITVEALAAHLALVLRDKLALDPAVVTALTVSVDESPGQGASTRIEMG